jgi:hypothetical protein
MTTGAIKRFYFFVRSKIAAARVFHSSAHGGSLFIRKLIDIGAMPFDCAPLR